MNIEQLRYLVAVAGYSSINRAATALHISQPSLSLSIKALEDELGYTLFTRSRQGIEMTVKGSLFLSQAKQVLLQFDNLATPQNETYREGLALRVAAMPFCRVHYAIAQFCRENQPLPTTISVEETLRDDVIELVSNLESEIGIVYAYDRGRKSFISQCTAKDVQCLPLSTCRASILIGRGNPLLMQRPERIAVAALKDFYRVSYGKSGMVSYLHTRIPGLGSTAGTIVVNDQLDFQNALATCPSFSVAPRGEKIYQINDITFATHYCEIEDVTITGEYLLLKHRDRSLSQPAEAFLNILKSWLE